MLCSADLQGRFKVDELVACCGADLHVIGTIPSVPAGKAHAQALTRRTLPCCREPCDGAGLLRYC